MKRIILAAILIFPILSLVAWVYWGATQPKLPSVNAAATNTPAVLTNMNGK
jgi:hypothetical protein